jgi:hypothetical protein
MKPWKRTVIKNGKSYTYWMVSWREGKKVHNEAYAMVVLPDAVFAHRVRLSLCDLRQNLSPFLGISKKKLGSRLFLV